MNSKLKWFEQNAKAGEKLEYSSRLYIFVGLKS